MFLEALLDNYVKDETKEDLTDAQKLQEEENFINTIAVEGGPVHLAFQYLKANGKTTAAVRLDLTTSSNGIFSYKCNYVTL